MGAHVVAHNVRGDVHRQRSELAIRARIAKTGDLICYKFELRFELLDVATMIARERTDYSRFSRFGSELDAAA